MDDEDNLKRRARRRLIGAVTLTLAIVLLLPLLLDSEPKSGNQGIELHIPDKDKVGEFEPKMAFPSMPVAATSASSVEGVSAPDATSAVSAAMPAAMPASSVPVASPQSAVPQQAAGKIKPETAPEIKSQPVPQTGFVVQIGAFANADSAHQLQKKLKKQGVKTYTEKVADKTRVRAGPFSTREAADKVRHKLEAQGLKPVVSPAP